MNIHHIYIIPDGLRPSGISTYGLMMQHSLNEKVTLMVLNHDQNERLVKENMVFVPRWKSHDAVELSRYITGVISEANETHFVILPNSGDTSFLAAALAMQRFVGLSKIVRTVGHVHLDSKNAYDYCLLNEKWISGFIPVSGVCYSKLNEMIPHRSNEIQQMMLPIQSKWPRLRMQLKRPLRLVYAGRLDNEDKQIHYLKTIADLLVNRNVPFVLHIYGSGKDEEDFKHKCSSLCEDSMLVFHGSIDSKKIEGHLRTNDILLLVSAREGSPLVVREAMAAGLCPIVMETNGCMAEIITDQVSGIIVAQGNYREMADRIEYFHRNRSDLHTIRMRSQASCNELNNPRHWDHYRRFVEHCMGQNCPTADDLRNSIEHTPNHIKIDSIVEQTEEIHQRIGVCGGGMFGRKVVDRILESGKSVVAVFDRNPELHGKEYKGIKYCPFEELKKYNFDTIIIGSVDFADEIEKMVFEQYSHSGDSKFNVIKWKIVSQS